MKYVKPEVVVVACAVDAVQTVRKSAVPSDGITPISPSAAYEADE
jgi:hypothetical protein